MNQFTVLMSVYIKEKPEFLRVAMDSVLNSTLLPKEVIVVEDGPLTSDLYEVLDLYKDNKIITRVKLEKNQGLTRALNKGLEKVSTDLVARMDTDDICREDRFEIQVNEFANNPELIVVGSNVSEFVNDENDIKSIKKMPLTGSEIVRFSRFRNPFNHPSVMFRKSFIEELGLYEDMPLFEDYYLWLKVIKSYGEKSVKNIDKELVSMRVVDDLYKRRGGFSYAVKSYNFRKEVIRKDLSPVFTGLIALIATSLVAVVPNFMRKTVYQKVLRRN